MKSTTAQLWLPSTNRFCFCASLHVSQPKASNKMTLCFLEWQDAERMGKTLWGLTIINIIFFKRKTCYALGFFKTSGFKSYCQLYITWAKISSFLDKLQIEGFCCLARYFNVLVFSALSETKKKKLRSLHYCQKPVQNPVI